MENLEEVLQALDEFQKMRPSEIPRELEDYLCWVAKTGDPVYQWSLIKTLFREKLTRVMTDFYESCPTLDLAPCPNVEHFNYDTMKSNLLERLESFANAPFTVQRICELLTAPRKEYNRVDKFMRAIEKNILVVSTREPGPIVRRNENGDGMVNGSVDEETSVVQPPQDIEMEYWEKDCSSTVTISVHTVENETPSLHTVAPHTSIVKNVFSSEDLSHEKVESSPSKSDIPISNFIPTASEFSGVSNLNSQTHTQDSQVGPAIQNLSTIVPETSGIVSDVSEAIMNEDTSSQPSLELENEGGDSIDPCKKLQTTFQTKDFSSNDNKSSKYHVDNSKDSEETEVGLISAQIHAGSSKPNEEAVKSIIEAKTMLDNKTSANPLADNLLDGPNKNPEEPVKSDSCMDTSPPIINLPVSSLEHKDPLLVGSTSIIDTSTMHNQDQSPSKVILPGGDNTSAEQISTVSEDVSVDVENSKDQSNEMDLVDDSKPIVEEPNPTDDAKENSSSDQEKSTLTIAEAPEDETTVMKSIVPDPIPIIEEPNDAECVTVKDSSQIMKVTEEIENQNSIVTCKLESEEKISVDDTSITELEGNTVAPSTNNTDENIMSKKGQEAADLMEVDEEGTIPVLQQDDEMMEQEAPQSTRS